MLEETLKLPTGLERGAWRAFFEAYFMKSDAPDYYRTHINRFVETLRFLPHSTKDGARALELGYTDVFQELLRSFAGYEEVHGTDFNTKTEDKSFFRTISYLRADNWFMMHRVNLEEEALPFTDGYFDFVLAGEIIEHMEVDPMYLMSELNRIIAPGGKLLLSTPNSASGRIVWSILNGYRPHFFMQYNRDRSLYKHNFEYDVHGLTELALAAGFQPELVQTVDCFAPPVPEALSILEKLGMPLKDRGDNIFLLATRVSGVVKRYPDGLYCG